MKRRFTLCALLASTLTTAAGAAPVIGVSVPMSGPNAALGMQVVTGVREAAARSDATVVQADDGCTADGGRAAAERLAAEKADIVVGFLCTEALEAALPSLRQAGIPAIDIGVRADRFTANRRKTGDLVWRLAPHAGAEAKALAALVVSRWRDIPFGILDDGSIYGRNLADAVRSEVESAGARPANVDAYRPAEEKQFGLVRRLARTGITHFVIAGDRSDAATIARDAASNGLALQIMGGEQLFDEPPDTAEIPQGTLAVGVRNRFRKLTRPGESDLSDRQGYYGPAFAATEVAVAAANAGRMREIRPDAVLGSAEFPTSLGAVRFDANGDSNLDLFRVFRFDGRDFVPEGGG